MKLPFRDHWIIAAGTLALLISAGLNAALAIRVSQQRTAIESAESEVQLQIGRRVEPFEATDRTGRRIWLDLRTDGRPTILYTFAPGCSWCERNHDAIVALHTQLSDRYRFIGLSLSEKRLSETLDRFPLPFDVVTDVDRDILETYQLGGTPRTLVLDSKGTIDANYYGAFIGNRGRLIAAKLNVDLPVVQSEN